MRGRFGRVVGLAFPALLSSFVFLLWAGPAESSGCILDDPGCDWGVVWTRSYTSSGMLYDAATGVAVDTEGNAWVVGQVEGNKWAIKKYSPAGTLLWSETLAAYYAAKSVAIDSQGNVVVVGRTSAPGTSSRWVIRKYDSSGVLKYDAFYQGALGADDFTTGVAIDSGNNIIVCGREQYGADQAEWVVRKYNPILNNTWSRSYSFGDGYDTPYGVAVDGSGNIFVAGDVRVSDHYEWTARKYDPSGNFLWNDRPFRGTAQGIAAMPGGEVVVTGQKIISSIAFWQTIRYGSSNATPTEIWSCEFNQPILGGVPIRGGIGQGVVKMKDCDDIAVVGYKDIGTGTNQDWYILRYSGAGNLLAYQSFNGPASLNDQALSVSVDPTNGDILVAGWETDTAGNGGVNWVVRRLRESYLAVSVTSSPANVAPGQAFSIIATVTNKSYGTCVLLCYSPGIGQGRAALVPRHCGNPVISFISDRVAC